MAYRTGSPTRSEFTRIISTACDRNQVAYCSHSKAHNFAQESPIEKIKVPFWSAINVFSGGVLISVSTKCGKWVVYGERVTNRRILNLAIWSLNQRMMLLLQYNVSLMAELQCKSWEKCLATLAGLFGTIPSHLCPLLSCVLTVRGETALEHVGPRFASPRVCLILVTCWRHKFPSRRQKEESLISHRQIKNLAWYISSHDSAVTIAPHEDTRQTVVWHHLLLTQAHPHMLYIKYTVVLEIIAGIKHCDPCKFWWFSLKCDF